MGKLSFDRRLGQKIFLCFGSSTEALRFTQSPIRLALWSLSLGVKWPRLEADHFHAHLHSLVLLKVPETEAGFVLILYPHVPNHRCHLRTATDSFIILLRLWILR
jgi:hypothetical protein